MKKESRTYNVILNTIFGVFSAVTMIFLNFIVKIFFVRILGEEINGIHSLFQNILNVLLLMEIGISTSILIHLYEPIKNSDKETLRLIMKFYKKIYINLSILFTTVSIIFSFLFLPRIITTTIDIKIVRIYFIIFILTSSINYLTYYKQTILYAEQKSRIISIINLVGQLLFRVLSIFLIHIYKNYYIFLWMLVLERLTINLICIAYVNKNHEYLNKKDDTELSFEKKNKIYVLARPVFLNNLSSSIQKSSIAILLSVISKNVSLVGYYGVYQLIIGAIEVLFSQFGGAFTSSFGNLYVEKDKNRMHLVYLKINFILNNIIIFLSTSFLFCIQNFITVIFGGNFLLEYSTVLLITLNLILYLLNIPIISIQNATGSHKKDDKIMFIQAILSIILGYLLGIKIGINGIFLVNLLLNLIFTVGYKGAIINKEILGKNIREYSLYILIEMLKIIFLIVMVPVINYFMHKNFSIFSLIHRIVTIVVVNIIYLLIINYKNKFFIDIIKKLKKGGYNENSNNI